MKSRIFQEMYLGFLLKLYRINPFLGFYFGFEIKIHDLQEVMYCQYDDIFKIYRKI